MDSQSGVDYLGGDYSNRRNISLQACQTMCVGDNRCPAFSYIKQKTGGLSRKSGGPIQFGCCQREEKLILRKLLMHQCMTWARRSVRTFFDCIIRS
jgi:hypothetical protein